MGKNPKRRPPPRLPPDDSYRRTGIGFTARGYVDGSLGRRGTKRPSFIVEVLPDAQGVHIGFDEDYWEEEEEDQ